MEATVEVTHRGSGYVAPVPDAAAPTDTAARRVPVGPALALATAPIVFVVGWATLGASIDGFSPVRMAISDVAAVGSPRRWQMFAVFVAYGLLLLVGAWALRAAGAVGSAGAAMVNALSVWGVAAFPVDGSARGDGIHGLFAAIGYVTLALMPALAVAPLRRAGRTGAAVASVWVAVVVALTLIGSAGNDRSGMFQRMGTTTGNLWMLAAGLALLTLGSRPGADGPAATERASCT